LVQPPATPPWRRSAGPVCLAGDSALAGQFESLAPRLRRSKFKAAICPDVLGKQPRRDVCNRPHAAFLASTPPLAPSKRSFLQWFDQHVGHLRHVLAEPPTTGQLLRQPRSQIEILMASKQNGILWGQIISHSYDQNPIEMTFVDFSEIPLYAPVSWAPPDNLCSQYQTSINNQRLSSSTRPGIPLTVNSRITYERGD
jgi:hypothetical protein